ncbi:GNAT superfamily N-acetyltransferase [Actinopolyspora biskrensis]|uniref:GNAT superfamily N-acetyltransferase n=1 Tax=Actinopolyspora biskrensis TaxID=1470178 RepID=A0A852ZD99_9ACTN|nr:GNAT family N-acetyltransferase [Actinopolyspora biskrensis]NYH79973.1 GNAT superfamily N-acetyltransferase [Actinopolyspora biskrensis]
MSGFRELVSYPRGQADGSARALGPLAGAAGFVSLTGVAQLVLLHSGLARSGALTFLITGSALLVAVALHVAGRAVIGPSRRRAGQGPPEEPITVPLESSPERELWRVRASVDDTPGNLAALTGQLALLDADIRTMQVHPVSDAAVDELLVHLPAGTGHDELVETVARAGAGRITAERTDPHELDDVPTRALRLAGDLVEGTVEPTRALRALLGEVSLRRAQSPEADTDELDGSTMRLLHPSGGVLTLHRTAGEFTPAEFARARSMLRLAGSCGQRLGRPVRELNAEDGSRVTLRPADRSDIALVRALHERCSSAGMHRRYFVTGTPTERQLDLLLAPALGRSTVALSERGELVAMGNLGYDGDDGDLALLVRDDWHGLGVGSALRDELLGHAGELGLNTVGALTQLDNTAMVRTLRSAGFRHTGAGEPGEWSWALDLRNGTAGSRARAGEAGSRRTLAETSPH